MMSSVSRSWLVSLALLGACADDAHVVVVVVSGRPAVTGIETLRVTLSTATASRTEDLALGGRALPVTFGVNAADRTGDLGIVVEALDDRGLVVGRGTGASMFTADDAAIRLETADFVVNTNFVDDQFLSSDFESNGNQLGVTADGTWLVAYREDCLTPCNMFGRRFDKDGRALESVLAASTMGFPLSTTLTSSISTPAVAGAGTTTLALWDYNDAVRVERGIACRAIDASGNAIGAQTSIAIDDSDVVAVTALSNQNFAVTWNSLTIPGKIQSAIVTPTCTTLGGAGLTAPVAIEASGQSFTRPQVGASGDSILYAWLSANSVHARVARNTNAFDTADLTVVSASLTDGIDYMRVVPFGDGFGVIARWTPLTGADGPGRIDLTRVLKTGATGPGLPILVTDKSGGDFQSAESFGAAASSTGTILIVWHACAVNGDGNGCGVFGRAIGPTGPLGDAFVIPTTTQGDQTDPSVVAVGPDAFAVAWNDKSATEPDKAGSAVRARIVYIDPASGD